MKHTVFCLIALALLLSSNTLNTIQTPTKMAIFTKGQDKQILQQDTINSKKPDIPNSINQKPQNISYKSLKTKIKATQEKYRQLYQKNPSASIITQAREQITHLLVQEIIPYWYGTEWDFNGYTAIPNQGEIACGYLVSTTLRDVGFKLNRYHFAQEAGYHAALSLQKKADLRIYKNLTPQQLHKQLIKNDKLADGLYFVGLDNHVGYLFIYKRELFFIHSNYMSDRVEIEYATEAFAFGSSIYVLADITHNDPLIQKWITREEVKIKRSR